MRVSPETIRLEQLGLAEAVCHQGDVEIVYAEKGRAVAAALHTTDPERLLRACESMAPVSRGERE